VNEASDRRYEPDTSPFGPRARPPLLNRTLPVSTHLAGYPKRDAKSDVIAGV
jgi:hypothetical protein